MTVHLDFSNGTSATMTDTEFQEKYPELHDHLNRPRPFDNSAYRQKRIDAGVTIRKFAEITKLRASDICDFEHGRNGGCEALKKYYDRLPV